MIVYVVITVFQGTFDDIEVFKTQKESDTYVAKLKEDDFTPEELEIVQNSLTIS